MIIYRYKGMTEVNLKVIQLHWSNVCYWFRLNIFGRSYGFVFRNKFCLKPLFSERIGKVWFKDFGDWRLNKVKDMP